MGKQRKPQIETTGKIEEKFEPTLLEQVWGVDNLSRYGTLDINEYQKQVENMTRADLEAHAKKMRVPICEGSLLLRDKLLSEFNSYVAMVRKPANPPRPNTHVNEAALKVLAEGR